MSQVLAWLKDVMTAPILGQPGDRSDLEPWDRGSLPPPIPFQYPRTYWNDAYLPLEQRRYFHDLKGRLDRGQYPDVEGQQGYLMGYAFCLIRTTPPAWYSELESRLRALSEAYAGSSPEFSLYADGWATECMLGQGKHEESLELTAAEDVFDANTRNAVRRLTVQFRVGLELELDDLVAFTPGHITRFTKRHAGRFRDILRHELSREVDAHESWAGLLFGPEPEGRPVEVFSNVPASRPGDAWERRRRPVAWVHYPMSGHRETRKRVRRAIRRSENMLRDEIGVPRIGEGWVSETALYHAIREAFPGTKVIQHGQPQWLGRQHLDVWIPAWKVAVEYHGTQHFEPVDFFGGEEAFRETQARDARKERLASHNGVHLIVATEEDSHEEVIERVRRAKVGRPRQERGT